MLLLGKSVRSAQIKESGTAVGVAMARTSVPPPAPRMVQRTRLFDVLDRGVEGPLTVLTGPPGGGKTQLLSSWLAARPRPGRVAWLSLEHADGRLVRFWSAVLEAISAAGAQLDWMAAPAPGDEAQFISALANAVGELSAPLVVVLDDFEQIRALPVIDSLNAWLRRPPEKLRLVIASRIDPGLSLQRLRLEGSLTELRSADLAFTPQQAAELFAIEGLDLTEKQVATLHARTEGWVAGLRLAALSLGGHPDPEEFVRTFAGDERTVADYLVEEALAQQPEPMRQFMLRTSVVEVVAPDLADALTGANDGAELLRRLERSNAFLVPLDERREWYRYHRLFAELLRSELRHWHPDDFVLQHRRAARWYAGHGMEVRAIRHALAGGDTATATDLLSVHWFSLVIQGEAVQLVDLIETLPRELPVRDAEVAIAAAGALLELGRLDRAEEYIGLADGRSGAVPAKRRADFALARTIVALLRARLRGCFDEAFVAAHKMLAGHTGAQLSAASSDRRALALLNLGIAEAWSGNVRHARGHLEDSVALARHRGCRYLELGGLSQLALLEALRGSLRHAQSLAREATMLAARRNWEELPQVAPAHLALGVVAYQWGEIGHAAEHLEQACTAAHFSRERTLDALIEIHKAMLLAARGDHEQAALVARGARNDAAQDPIPPALAVALVSVEATSLAATGDAEAALGVLQGAPAKARWSELDIVRGLVALAGGDPAEALRWFDPDRDILVYTLHPSTGISMLAHAAVARHLLHDDDASLATLERGLARAEPDGYRRPLLAVGAPLRELLDRRIRAGTAHRALAGELIEALDRGVTEAGKRVLLDPLSERERVVLRYLPTDLSKAEIASEMFLSVNTVKTHMKNIYRKLDVTNRSEAVRRARSLHLV